MLTPVLAVGTLAFAEWVCARNEYEILLLPFLEAFRVAPILGMTSHLCGDIATPVCRTDTTPTQRV